MVGHIPFLRNGVLYPWSELDPDRVHLCVAVMPDCQHLLEKDRITVPPPQQGNVFTIFAPRSFRCSNCFLSAFKEIISRSSLSSSLSMNPCRTSIRIHRLLQYIQRRVETDLRVWRYLLPPGEEQDGHEIQGTLPVWQPVSKTAHLICQTGNARDGQESEKCMNAPCNCIF